MGRIRLTALLGLVSGAAMAAEGEANLFAGDVGNAIWTLVIFVVLILVLGKFAWGPLLGALQQRENFIRHSLEQAKDDREAAEKLLRDHTAKIEAAHAEAKEIVELGRAGAEKIRLRTEEDSRREAEKMIERAKREIDLAKQAAIAEVYLSTADLATEIAGRILKRELDPSDHARLISESLEEFTRLDRS